MPERFDWPAIKHDFDTNGFVRISGFLAPAPAAEAARRLEMFIRDVVPKIPAQEVYYEIEDQVDTIKSITSLAEHDPYFRWRPPGLATAYSVGGAYPCGHLL